MSNESEDFGAPDCVQIKSDKDLEEKLLAGLRSEVVGVWTKKDFEDLKADLRRRFGKNQLPTTRKPEESGGG